MRHIPQHALAAFYARSKRSLIIDPIEREAARIARRNAKRQREAARRELLSDRSERYVIDPASSVLTRVA